MIVHDDNEITITDYFLGDFLAPDDGKRQGRGGTESDALADIPIVAAAGFVGFFPFFSFRARPLRDIADGRDETVFRPRRSLPEAERRCR